MDPLPSKPPKPQSPAAKDFIPEKININHMRRGRRRGAGAQDKKNAVAPGGGNDTTKSIPDDGGAGQRLDTHNASQNSISNSVVFHEESELLDELDKLDEFFPHGHEGGEIVPSPTDGNRNSGASGENVVARNSGGGQLSNTYQSSPIASSVVFHENDNLFDEIDALNPHEHEGGKIVADPHSSMGSTSYSLSDSNSNSRPRSNSRSITSSLLQSLQNSLAGGRIPTDYESLLSSSNDRPLSQIIADIEERLHESVTLTRSGQFDPVTDGIGNGSGLSPKNASKRASIVGGYENNDTTPSTVDWSSLSKSCKRAKAAFRDADSGQMVIKNMFLTHLDALTSVLTSYAQTYCGGRDQKYNESNGRRLSLDEMKTRTSEIKRALRFAMACLAPPNVEQDSKMAPDGVEKGEDVERYRFARRYRQELQEIAVRGFDSNSKTNQQKELRHQYGLQIPLAEIIYGDGPGTSPEVNANISADEGNGTHSAIKDSIEREKRTVRVLAARLLCNLVTDNPMAAEIVLRAVPFSPTSDQIEARMAATLGPGGAVNEDGVIFWSDLVDATAKVQGVDKISKRGDNTEDREALAAVAAALHNLLASLEAVELLIELDDVMKRRENAKQHQDGDEEEFEHRSSKPIDVGFQVASNGPLMNALLRNIIPAKAVLIQSQFEKQHAEATRPKLQGLPSAPDYLSDSATEWISLVLERLASRSLLPQMLKTAGGTKSDTVTPEQVVLASCIRQAVDDYHSALTASGDAGGFGRRRLSIAAKTTGMAVATRPHPLWGRAANSSAGGRSVGGRDSRAAVPVLLALANDAETFRLRAIILRESNSTEELYDGELNCTIRIIDDICDMIAQSLGRHVTSSNVGATDNERLKQCCIADARSVLGRETSLIASCCKDLARVLDTALANNSGRKARDMQLSSQDQQTAIVMVRLIANLIYQSRYNQDTLRITSIPMLALDNEAQSSSSNFGVHSNPNTGKHTGRTGLHVILSATSLAPICFTLREWCIVAIRNAVESNAANAETVRRLEANQVLGDTPELQRLGVKVEMDEKGKMQVTRRDSSEV
eukprot:CAMPEP_0183740570 /NCGR_PEP_ID=MMETSP0737-20130205/59979_1 /TAXON_ID=385413 /ORGANISM="Thalassiosira miniscula, Strain CCMP1093" /LENGTH=1061 /DNA_ID=CAMNT_0025975673 /DNA_START=26 /DNA_END=3211 /DNA_ORIENTATION=-